MPAVKRETAAKKAAAEESTAAAAPATAPAAASKVLAPTESFLDILSTNLYLKGVLTNIIFTFGINFMITRSTSANKPSTWVYWGEDTVPGLIFFFLLIPTLFTVMRGEIHKAILEGAVRPLSSYAMARNPMTNKGLAYSCCIAGGWRRFVPFVFNVAMFPGVGVAGVLTFLCNTHRDLISGTCHIGGVDSGFGTDEAESGRIDFVLLDAAWKTIAVVIIYTMNFIACHHELEPELAPFVPKHGVAPAAAAAAVEEDSKTK